MTNATHYGHPATLVIKDTEDKRPFVTPTAYADWATLRKWHAIAGYSEEAINKLEAMPETESHIYRVHLVQEGAEAGDIYYSPAADRYYRTWEGFYPDTEFLEASRTHRPARISIDNGNTWLTADELFEKAEFLRNFGYYWAKILDRMDKDIRESLYGTFSENDEGTFLCAYCERTGRDFCIN